ncbi:MAG TPA: hypothetical protein VM925_12805 [Labilithrix sp.]|nr:hypothetical protein [Labilithrix sp.]
MRLLRPAILFVSGLIATLAEAACSIEIDAAPSPPDAGGADGHAESNDGSEPSDGDGGAVVGVRILAFNDFHGNLEPPTGSGGLVTIPVTDPLVAKLGVDGGVITKADAGVATVPAGGAAFLAAHVNELRMSPADTTIVFGWDLRSSFT